MAEKGGHHPSEGSPAYPRVLILDELGYLPLTREEASLFFRVLVRRYERAGLIVRLLHHATTVNIKRDTYRLREKKKPTGTNSSGE